MQNTFVKTNHRRVCLKYPKEKGRTSKRIPYHDNNCKCIKRQWPIKIILDVMINKNIKLSSFKSSENIQKTEGRPDSTVLNNQFSSVTLNTLAMNARERERER